MTFSIVCYWQFYESLCATLRNIKLHKGEHATCNINSKKNLCRFLDIKWDGFDERMQLWSQLILLHKPRSHTESQHETDTWLLYTKTCGAYFYVEAGDQDKSWAPHIDCRRCLQHMRQLTSGARTKAENCYFYHLEWIKWLIWQMLLLPSQCFATSQKKRRL